MNPSKVHRVVFVCEGETELYFYETLLSHLSYRNLAFEYCIRFDEQRNEYVHQMISSENIVFAVMKVVGTITQVVHIAQWFSQYKKELPADKWTVFLCYDTDSYKSEIAKFYEGDWDSLRSKLKANNVQIIDLAASAMIEDILLLDPKGICSFLSVPYQSIPNAANGKVAMKKFFRAHAAVYHEGERAKSLIECLDMDKILRESDLPLEQVELHCFPV